MKYLDQGIASIAVCLLGAYAMRVTRGSTGIGWAILGLWLIWSQRIEKKVVVSNKGDKNAEN